MTVYCHKIYQPTEYASVLFKFYFTPIPYTEKLKESNLLIQGPKPRIPVVWLQIQCYLHFLKAVFYAIASLSSITILLKV